MNKTIAILFALAPLATASSTGHGRSETDSDNRVVTAISAPLTVPAAGNGYHVSGARVVIPRTADGWFTLVDPTSVVDIFFRVGAAGELNLGLVGNAGGNGNKGTLRVTVGGIDHTVVMTGAVNEFYPVGVVNIAAPGYVRVSLAGISKTADIYGNVLGLRAGGSATSGVNNYCTVENLANPADNWALWARRGPSVHLNYGIGANAEYFYNELTVPVGEDVIASYFMSNGFGEGYCGFQVNSPTERRILFSVWSPYSTDDPRTIPPDQEVVLVARGPGVRAQDFGGEGSGGQSYLVYPWKAGVTYKVLTRVGYHGPSGFESFPHLNEYTAWFFDPETDSWRLIASWRRPDKSKKTYPGAHSFLENFSPTQGHITREVCFGNQWTRGIDGVWTELTDARFTHDNTANRGLRADYWGGVKGNRFVLKNCGFFDENTPGRTVFTRAANGPTARPDIDFDALEKLLSE